MKYKNVLLLIFLSICTASVAAQNRQTNSVYFTNIQPEYKSFNEIEPILVNNSKQSIYIKFALGGAKLKRFNEETGEWEFGAQRKGCLTGARPSELSSAANKKIYVDWRFPTGYVKDPNIFILQNLGTQRPYVGTYKIFLPYAFEEWSIGKIPKEIYFVESYEFRIVP